MQEKLEPVVAAPQFPLRSFSPTHIEAVIDFRNHCALPPPLFASARRMTPLFTSRPLTCKSSSLMTLLTSPKRERAFRTYSPNRGLPASSGLTHKVRLTTGGSERT